MKKKKQPRELFWDLYGELVEVCIAEAAAFGDLCHQSSDWSDHADKLKKCIASGLLGNKLFSGLQQYVCGAQVSRRCQNIFDEWERQGARVTHEDFEANITTVSNDVTEISSDITDGLKRAIELTVGSLKFQMVVSSFQEDFCLRFLK